MQKKSLYIVVVCSVVGASCGGGASSPASVGPSQVGELGNARFSYQGSANAQIQTTSAGLSVATFAGVTLTGFNVNPAQTNENSALSYLTTGAVVYEYQNGFSQTINTGTNLGAFDSKFDHAGHMYFTAETAAPQGVIVRCNYDGSSPTTVLSEAGVPQNIDVSASDAYIAFDVYEAGLYSCTTSGGGVTSLDTAGSEPAINPNSTKVAYVKTVGGYTQIFTVPITGGTGTQLTTDSVNHYYPAWTSDGLAVYCDYDNGTTRTIMGYFATGAAAGAQYDTLLTSNFPYSSQVAFSPDGKYFAVTQRASYSGNASTDYVATMTANGGNLAQIASGASSPAWSPFFPNKVFVGSGGALATSAAGFIFTQLQTGFDSLVSFSATTPSSTTVTPLDQAPAGGTGPFVYDVYGENLSNVTYTNNYDGAVHPTTLDVTNCLVSIDATTGQVNSIAPFLVARGTPLQANKASLEFHAHFTAVYDKNGKNLAPSGASDLVLDPKHGSVLSVR